MLERRALLVIGGLDNLVRLVATVPKAEARLLVDEFIASAVDMLAG